MVLYIISLIIQSRTRFANFRPLSMQLTIFFMFVYQKIFKRRKITNKPEVGETGDNLESLQRRKWNLKLEIKLYALFTFACFISGQGKRRATYSTKFLILSLEFKYILGNNIQIPLSNFCLPRLSPKHHNIRGVPRQRIVEKSKNSQRNTEDNL